MSQKKILALIEKMITDTGLEFEQRSNWANCGTLSIERPETFGQLASVHYNFQSDTFTLSIYRIVNGREVGVPSQPPRQGYFDFYGSYFDTGIWKSFSKRLAEVLGDLAPGSAPVTAAPGKPPLKGVSPVTVAVPREALRNLVAAVQNLGQPEGFKAARDAIKPIQELLD